MSNSLPSLAPISAPSGDTGIALDLKAATSQTLTWPKISLDLNQPSEEMEVKLVEVKPRIFKEGPNLDGHMPCSQTSTFGSFWALNSDFEPKHQESRKALKAIEHWQMQKQISKTCEFLIRGRGICTTIS